MDFLRYENDRLVVSPMNAMDDVIDWFRFLQARDYLEDLLKIKHGLPAADARTRSTAIIPHVRMAVNYIQQSLDGPPSISYLPAYYAILNLMKIYVLLGPEYSQLSKNRYHGATYAVGGKDSQSIMTEHISLKTGGVFPLFYKTITGKTLTTSKKGLRVDLRDILPCVSGVTHEFELASGQPSALQIMALDQFQSPQGIRPRVRFPNVAPNMALSVSHLRALRGFTAEPGVANSFIGKPVTNAANFLAETRVQLRTYLLYRVHHQVIIVPVCRRRMELPSELPVAILFFYMSSVVRYRPEFFEKLRDSKYWAMIASARTHSFFSFLLDFWSFMHQENYFVNPYVIR